ncbi:hypothetical protein Cch01nite_16140 [Cellulomonas chitinilytica]|uniref:HTH cro/C1-type domain-containing protein n=2 Tax=Cellulomonas chitinilytica TaxID=398759 RepID=A0A919P1E5_9CELL|nr:hypothetical protein Cch01nite_16140 [Cellulomonas chitinilytica]
MIGADESPRMRWYRARTKLALGSALQSIRRNAHDTQDDAAAKFHSSRPHLSRIERGTTPQLDTLMDYMDGYGYEIVLVPRGSTVTVEPPR